MADEKEVSVDFQEKVKLVATKKAPFHSEGEEFEAHPLLAEDFIAKGYATKK